MELHRKQRETLMTTQANIIYVDSPFERLFMLSKDKTIAIELGHYLTSKGETVMFDHMVSNADKIMTTCQSLVDNKRYGNILELSVYHSRDPFDSSSNKFGLAVSMETDVYSICIRCDSINDVHSVLYNKLGIPSPP